MLSRIFSLGLSIGEQHAFGKGQRREESSPTSAMSCVQELSIIGDAAVGIIH